MNQNRTTLSFGKKFFFATLVTVAFCITIEGGFRVLEIVWPARNIDLGLGFNSDSRVFRPSLSQPDWMETAPSKRVSFIRQRFETAKPSGTFRIVALGGSSINYLEPQFRSLEHTLSRDFKERYDNVEIINCGGFAYGSHRLVIVSREIMEYSPDLILLYTGHNEFEEVEQLNLSAVEHLNFERAISRSAAIRFLRDRKTDFHISKLEKEHNQRVLAREEPVSESNFARAWTYRFTKQDVVERMKTYEQNLRLILDLAQRERVPVVMGTVASNLLRPYLPQETAGQYKEVYELWKKDSIDEGIVLAKSILVDTVGRHQSSDLENNIARKLAVEYSVPLVDVESNVAAAEPHGIPGETMFDDHCHLNEAGRQIWIKGYEPKIRQLMTNDSPD